MIYIATLSAEDPDGMNKAFTYSARDSQSFRIGGTNQDQLFFLGPLHFEHTQVLVFIFESLITVDYTWKRYLQLWFKVC
jgi:hypothetical protein